MSRSPSLDDYIPPGEPCATFHDASLLSILIDYEGKEMVSEWDLCVGDPEADDEEARERRRRGKLRFTGLLFWVMEAPDERYVVHHHESPWLTSDGPLAEAGTSTAKTLDRLLPSDVSGWYLFFSDLNSFAYCAARGGTFQWND
jgi:hypothetical protein